MHAYGIAWHGMAWHGMACAQVRDVHAYIWHGMAWDGGWLSRGASRISRIRSWSRVPELDLEAEISISGTMLRSQG